MKKIITVALLTTALSTVAFAQQGGFSGPSDVPPPHTQVKGGFSGPAEGLTTVEQAKMLKDDAWVILRGNIEKQISPKHYMFKDQSGSIVVEIDAKRWEGQTITPQDQIEISGKMDKDRKSIEVEVKQIKKVN